MTKAFIKNATGILGFALLSLGSAMAWLPAGLMVAGVLMLAFAIVGILRGDD